MTKVLTSSAVEGEAVAPLKAALRAYAVASKNTRCPICNSIEGCDHTVKERLCADLTRPAAADAKANECRTCLDSGEISGTCGGMPSEELGAVPCPDCRPSAGVREALADIEAISDRCINEEYYTSKMALDDIANIRSVIKRASLSLAAKREQGE
jgi:hypothetical protein